MPRREFNLTDLNGANGFVLDGITGSNSSSGTSVSSAGDINGDGLSDMLIGAPDADGLGKVYVVFGHPGEWDANMMLSSLDGRNGFVLVGTMEFVSSAGYSVASAGDVNGDGFSDLLIGAPTTTYYDPNPGRSYVVFGHAPDYMPPMQSLAYDTTIIVVSMMSSLVFMGLLLFLFRRHNVNQLHQYITQASDQDDSLNKIAEVVFEKIRLTSFLKTIPKERVAEYVDAIKVILQELEAMGFSMDLATMADKTKAHFLEELPKQIRAAFPVSGQCGLQFFKAEILPSEIKTEANSIAQNIKHAMDSVDTHIINDGENRPLLDSKVATRLVP